MMNKVHYRAEEWVEIRSKEEILATLDTEDRIVAWWHEIWFERVPERDTANANRIAAKSAI